MTAILLFSSILFLIVFINHVNKLENTTLFKRATPEEQKKMIEARDRAARGTGRVAISGTPYGM